MLFSEMLSTFFTNIAITFMKLSFMLLFGINVCINFRAVIATKKRRFFIKLLVEIINIKRNHIHNFCSWRILMRKGRKKKRSTRNVVVVEWLCVEGTTTPRAAPKLLGDAPQEKNFWQGGFSGQCLLSGLSCLLRSTPEHRCRLYIHRYIHDDGKLVENWIHYVIFILPPAQFSFQNICVWPRAHGLSHSKNTTKIKLFPYLTHTH